jgi:hypothetical protein
MVLCRRRTPAIRRKEISSGWRAGGFQNPKPTRRGEWWTLRVWKTTFTNGQLKRMRERIKLAPATMGAREVQKLAAEYLRPLNQGLETIGSATNFQHYVETTYIPVVMPSMAKST